jgi:hypothetical protein
MGKWTVLIGLLFLDCIANSQVLPESNWKRIDSNINKKNNLASLPELLRQLRQKALAESDYFQVARSYYYEILIADQKTEDSLYFLNSVCIDSILKATPDNNELLLAMHLLQAKRLSKFTQMYLKFNRQRYERKDIPVNYAAYINAELDSIAGIHFEEAKRIARIISMNETGDALWLSTDPLLFLFRPGLFDIVIAEQIQNIKQSYYSFLPTIRQQQLLSLSQDAFIGSMDSLENVQQSQFPRLKYYKEWLNYEKNNPVAYYFIETLARKFLYEAIVRGNKAARKISAEYENYLQQIVLSPYNTVRAHAVYQLCLRWNQQSKKYFPSDGYEYDYETGTSRDDKDYDTAYRYHALKAMQLFEQHKAMLDNFAYLKDILLKMEQDIRATDISMQVEEYNLPREPMLAELFFKNVEKLFYNVVRVKSNFSYSLYKSPDRLSAVLAQLPMVVKGTIDLPASNDFNKHAVFIKLNALPTGNYALLFSYHPLEDSGVGAEHLFFEVSSIATLQKQNRIFVLDRKTGFPLDGATVKGIHFRNPKDTFEQIQPVSRTYTVNKEGFIEIDDSKIEELEVYYKGDTVLTTVLMESKEENYKAEDVYDKEKYNDLVEYYEDNASVEIFTDRNIYRPGQTVYFKTIFMTKNPKTGEPMVMTKKNLKGSLFNNVYKKWLKESEPVLYLYDPFHNDTDTFPIRLNDYGSMSGSFKIPKSAATGEWSIEPDYLDQGRNSGSFKVEEYKRPSYEVSIETPKKQLLPGDTFSIRIKVKSFAGAMLNHVRIRYAVERNGDIFYYDSLLNKSTERNTAIDIADTSDYTDANGELLFIVNDSLLKEYSLRNDKEWYFTYRIDVEATDLTGENYEADAKINVSSRPVNIRLSMSDKLNRDEKSSIAITTNDRNEGKISKNITVKIYRLIKDEEIFTDRKLIGTDFWLHDKSLLQQWFPLIDFSTTEDTGTKKLVLEKIVNTGKDNTLEFDRNLFNAGTYIVEAVCEENGIQRGYSKRSFSVFDEKGNKLPQRTWTFYRLPFNSFFPGDSVKYIYGNSEAPVYSIFYLEYYSGKKKISIAHYYEMVKQEKGINRWNWKIPTNAIDEVLLTQMYVLENQLFSHTETIYINNKSLEEPEIIIEQYRQKLSPGSQETFSISIKTRDVNTAAELMTTMYDASLDKLEKHSWELPRHDRRRSLNRYENNYINWNVNSINYRRSSDTYSATTWVQPLRTGSLWWLQFMPTSYDEDMMGAWSFSASVAKRDRLSSDFDGIPGATSSLMGRAAGISIASTQGLSEVVVVGYNSSERRKDMTGAVVTIRGTTSLLSYRQPFVILDGAPFEDDLGKLDPNIITQGVILKGADATALYGSKASNGILVLSTKGPIVFPSQPPEPPLPSRKNFNETAFFFPAIYAGKDGYYRFSFTMPESLTEWNWKLLAHTKQLHFVYIERKLTTQLPLMVQPNMPRLFYQGDRVVLQSRVSNLDSTNANGKVICKIEDVVTGEDVTSRFVPGSENEFSVNKKSNVATAFEIKVPYGQLNPVKIIISARSKNFADAEEHIIPVLSSKILVRESTPFRFTGRDTILRPIPLPAGFELYGIGISIQPKPQSALIYALPYLTNYSFDCAEQTFNKLRAQLIAFKIMRTDKETQQSFDKAKKAMEILPAQAEQSPSDIDGLAMPWLSLINKTAKQQKQLFELLDTSRAIDYIRKHMDKLYKLQNADGGLTWFDGGKSDPYISNYVLAGFGKSRKDNLLNLQSVFDKKYSDFIAALLSYCDKQFLSSTEETIQFDDPLFYIYARSYWNEKFPTADSLSKKIQHVLDKKWEKAGDYDLYIQAMLIIASFRYEPADKNKDKAIQLLTSIGQLAIRDENNGIRWKDLADAEEMSNSSEETLALLAEAFSERSTDPAIIPGIVQWLLATKNDDYWTSTKATSAVIGMLFKEMKTVIGPSQTINGISGNKGFSVTNDLLKGSSYSFVEAKMLTRLQLKKDDTIPASGNFTGYYFSPADSLQKLNKNIGLKKELFRYNETDRQWVLVTDQTLLKIADKVKVVLTIETSRALRYVYLDDKRAAAFEPGENSSGHRREQGLSYYLSIRDAGMQFFLDFIPSGRFVISYEMIVAQEGNFTSGPALLQCMYRPEISAYSNGMKVQTLK